MAARRDYYDVLGVPRDASDADVKKAFRRLARELHPDVNPAPEAGERFREAAEAYEVLSDADTRARYDRFGHDGIAGTQFHTEQFMDFSSLSDLLGAFFGDDIFSGGRRARPRGGDAGATIELTLAEAAFGVTREVAVDVIAGMRALRRDGRRAGDDTSSSARECGGSGPRPARRPDGVRPVRAGVRLRGVRRPRRPHRLAVPASAAAAAGSRSAGASRSRCRAGIASGQRLRLAGRGHDGEGGAGDLYVQVAGRARPAVRA